jgi:CBS domain-containing protein
VTVRGSEHYESEVATIPADASALQIAKQMKSQELGSVVVIEDGKAVGIVTDRDLLRRVICMHRDAESTPAREIMSWPVVTVDPGTPLERVIEVMAGHGVRRVPVVRDGRLAGIVSLDDLLLLLSDELRDLAEGARRGFLDAQRVARARHVVHDVEAGMHDLRDQIERLGGEAKELLIRQIDAIRERTRRHKP